MKKLLFYLLFFSIISILLNCGGNSTTDDEKNIGNSDGQIIEFSKKTDICRPGEVIHIYCNVPDAKIYYTTNGNEPTNLDTEYNDDTPIAINSKTTIKARAYASDWESDTIEKEYLSLINLTEDLQYNFLSEMTYCNGNVFFTGWTNDLVTVLFATDGTPENSRQITNVDWAYNLTPFKNEIFFSGYDSSNDRELWKSDSTEAGTVMVKDINPSGDSEVSNIIEYNNSLYFRANDGVNGNEIWNSDGTEQNTVLLKAINNGPDGSEPTDATTTFDFKIANHGLIFAANDGIHGTELWKSDSTSTGTNMIKDINPGDGSSTGWSTSLMRIEDYVYFVAYNPSHSGYALWRTDGTDSGTTYFSILNNVFEMCKLNNTYIFFCGSLGLWAMEGENGIAEKILSESVDPYYAILDNYVYFVANGVLYKSDGTSNGTSILLNSSVESTSLFAANDAVYFAGEDMELWKTDGTEAGTVLACNINEDGTSNPSNFMLIDDTLYFFAITKTGKHDLLRLDL